MLHDVSTILDPQTAAVDDGSGITLINVFEVREDKAEEVLARWENARDFLSREPGYRGTILHANIDPAARFRFVNVARWSSEETFRDAIAKMTAAGIFPPMDGVTYTPGVYRRVRVDAAPAC